MSKLELGTRIAYVGMVDSAGDTWDKLRLVEAGAADFAEIREVGGVMGVYYVGYQRTLKQHIAPRSPDECPADEENTGDDHPEDPEKYGKTAYISDHGQDSLVCPNRAPSTPRPKRTRDRANAHPHERARMVHRSHTRT